MVDFSCKMELKCNGENKVLKDGKKYRQQQKENRLAGYVYIQRKSPVSIHPVAEAPKEVLV